MNTQIDHRCPAHSDEGFTLIELLIVMSVILILMTLAIPQYLKVHIGADETSAAQSMKAIAAAEVQYNQAYPQNGFACTLSQLGGIPGSGPPTPESAQALDPGLAGGSKSGYLFSISNCTKVTVNNQDMFTGYKVTGVPASVGRSGNCGFCMDENNLITYDPQGGTNCTTRLE